MLYVVMTGARYVRSDIRSAHRNVLKEGKKKKVAASAGHCCVG